MSELLTVENMGSIISGQASVPEIDEHENMVSMRSSELQGSFKSPRLGDSKEHSNGKA